jgi:DNA-binding response OmpR family regulator
MKKILVVEDHESLRLSIRTCLFNEGFEPTVVASISEARAALKEKPDLIVLDWMLPDGQGIDLLNEIRAAGSNTPVIFLTARADVFDKVIALELGASDYMTKPFEPRELIARVRARLRDATGASSTAHDGSATFTVGSLKIDPLKRKVQFRGQDVDMVKKEFDLLSFFAQSPETVFSRDEILNKVWGYEVYPTTRTVDMHVMLLRQKLDESLIETVRAVGYKFNPR